MTDMYRAVPKNRSGSVFTIYKELHPAADGLKAMSDGGMDLSGRRVSLRKQYGKLRPDKTE